MLTNARADELRSAAGSAAAAAAVGWRPAFQRPWQSLRDAALSLTPAWSGSWLPGYANLYERRLHALPRALGLPTDAARVRPAPALFERCRVWTPQQVHDVICQMARQQPADVDALVEMSTVALRQLDDARLRFDALVGRHHAGPDIASLREAADAIRTRNRWDLIDAWRPAYADRSVARELLFEGPPAHIAELAALEALTSPFVALRQFADLMLNAARCVDASAGWRDTLSVQALARHLNLKPA